MSASFREDWRVGTALLCTIFAIGLIGAVIIILLGGAVPGPAPSKEIAVCSDEPHINDEVNKIAFQALDEALRQQIENLFLTWMKDASGQPARAAVGVRSAIFAYVHAKAAILEWNIPLCKP